ncbi:MAG: hypothetical protein GY729_15410, partial [Desulfobacteraceae bacterium]|nr:hypothetical protein [Desulfobacteraceae bacterium]
ACTKEKAVENKYKRLSLIVFKDNNVALPVYHQSGFHKVQDVELGQNKIIHHIGGCYLLRCGITGRQASSDRN